MNWERRKQSEEWTKTKANEFVSLESDLTFSEWCYRQGEADMLKVFLCGFKEGLSDYATQKIVTECTKKETVESPNCDICPDNRYIGHGLYECNAYGECPYIKNEKEQK